MVQVIREIDVQLQHSLETNVLDCNLNVHTTASKLVVSRITHTSGKHPQFSLYLDCDMQNNFYNKLFQCYVSNLRGAEASPLSSSQLCVFTQIVKISHACQENWKSTKCGTSLAIDKNCGKKGEKIRAKDYREKSYSILF